MIPNMQMDMKMGIVVCFLKENSIVVGEGLNTNNANRERPSNDMLVYSIDRKSERLVKVLTLFLTMDLVLLVQLVRPLIFGLDK